MFDYEKAKYERHACNFCGLDNKDTISRRDRHGLAVQTVICENCGLIFIDPRMSREDYDQFYNHEYRQLRPRSEGVDDYRENLDKMFQGAMAWGREIAEKVKPHITSGLTIEVGSSVGGILKGFQGVIGGGMLGIEPSPDESAYAEKMGIKTHVSLFENFKENIPRADNVLIVRSFNHLLDPKKFLTQANHGLKENGHLIITVLDFVKVCQRKGRIYTQIDHPFMFNPAVLCGFVKSAGFNINLLANFKNRYILIVGEKSGNQPFVSLSIPNNSYGEVKKSLKWGRIKIKYVFHWLRSFAERWKIRAYRMLHGQ